MEIKQAKATENSNETFKSIPKLPTESCCMDFSLTSKSSLFLNFDCNYALNGPTGFALYHCTGGAMFPQMSLRKGFLVKQWNPRRRKFGLLINLQSVPFTSDNHYYFSYDHLEGWGF